MDDYQAHDTAIIDKGAVIGKNTKIWHWTHICKGATIGKNCSFGQNVYIGNKVKIGNNVRIQNNVSVYDGVEIQDNVFCGPSMVFTNVYNPRALIPRKNEIKKTYVQEGATIGANATIICGTKIGRYSFIAAGALVNKNIGDYELIIGVPGKLIGWMSEYGEQIYFDNQLDSRTFCKKSNSEYQIKNKKVSKI